MHKGKVTKQDQHIKLVLNGVPEGTFDINQILSSLELNYKAFCITMMREVMNSVIEGEVNALPERIMSEPRPTGGHRHQGS